MRSPLRARTCLLLVALVGACGPSQQAATQPEGTATTTPASTSGSPVGGSAPNTPDSAQLASRPAPQTSTSTPTSTSGSTAPREKPKKVSASHVLVQYMGAERAGNAVVRTREQARAVADKVLERARAGDDFSRLAVDYSDEPGAAQRGGSLGRFGHGQMVRAFEDAAFALDVGGVSDIVETSFGFHVIKRTE